MSKFELVEFEFDPDSFSLSLEDEFLMTTTKKEIESVDSPTLLKDAALKLLSLAIGRQAVIRGLIRRIAKLEKGAVSRIYEN